MTKRERERDDQERERKRWPRERERERWPTETERQRKRETREWVGPWILASHHNSQQARESLMLCSGEKSHAWMNKCIKMYILCVKTSTQNLVRSHPLKGTSGEEAPALLVGMNWELDSGAVFPVDLCSLVSQDLGFESCENVAVNLAFWLYVAVCVCDGVSKGWHVGQECVYGCEPGCNFAWRVCVCVWCLQCVLYKYCYYV